MIPAGAHLRLSLDRKVVVALWDPPRASGGILVAPLVQRVGVARGRREVGVPEGAVWGGVFDPEGEPPLLLGAFQVLNGVQELRVLVDSRSGALLRGDGILELAGPNEFDRALREIADAGLKLPNPEPDSYPPPFPLWWVRVGPIPIPPGEEARAAAAGAKDQPPTIPEALRFAADDPEYGGRLPPDVLARYPAVREVPTERVVAHAPGADRFPERRSIPAPTRWVIAAAADGSRLVMLALRDPISGADRVVYAAVAPSGEVPSGTDIVVFERYYPGARDELGRVLSGAPAPPAPPEGGPGARAGPGADTGGNEGRWGLDRWLPRESGESGESGGR